jgi:hypothetical protein
MFQLVAETAAPYAGNLALVALDKIRQDDLADLEHGINGL